MSNCQFIFKLTQHVQEKDCHVTLTLPFPSPLKFPSDPNFTWFLHFLGFDWVRTFLSRKWGSLEWPPTMSIGIHFRWSQWFKTRTGCGSRCREACWWWWSGCSWLQNTCTVMRERETVLRAIEPLNRWRQECPCMSMHSQHVARPFVSCDYNVYLFKC